MTATQMGDWARGNGADFLARAGFVAAAIYVFKTALKLYQGSGIWAPSIPLGISFYVIATAFLLAAFVVRRPISKVWQAAVMGLLLIAITASFWYEVDFANPSYGTDAIALAHNSGELLVEGANPYEVAGASMNDILDRFGLPETFITRSTSGDAIDRLVSYPAGHVLAYSLGVAVGFEDLRWITLIFELASLTLLWVFLSPIARLLVPFALLLEDNLAVFFTSGGVTDWLWVLPLIGAAVLLHRERYGYAGLTLGLACAMKQQPWILVPFVLIWIFRKLATRVSTESLRQQLGAFVSGVLGGFVVVNLPFMLWSFESWIAGTLHPVLGDLVPDGQGFSLLSSRGILSIPSDTFTVVLVLLFIFSLVAYYRWFERLQDLLWVFPPALLLVSHRSFHSYFIYWMPIALLWLDLRINQSEPELAGSGMLSRDAGSRASARMWVITLVVIAVALFAGGAVWARSAEPLQVGNVEPRIEGGVLAAISVEITNPSNAEIRPVFELYWHGQPVPWRSAGRGSVGPRETETIELVPTGPDVIPPTRLSQSGGAEVVDFRIRVNRSGTGVYSASEIVNVPLDVAIVNPFFSFWTRQSAVVDSPYGWHATQHGGVESERSIAPMADDSGVTLAVSSRGSGEVDWIETALIQDVAYFAGCYRWVFENDLGFMTDQGGSSIAVSGLQFVQGGSSVWFVPSNTSDERVSTIDAGTRLVEVPVSEGVTTTALIDIESHVAPGGIDLSEGGIVKVFAAVHQTIVADSRLSVESLDAVACSDAPEARSTSSRIG